MATQYNARVPQIEYVIDRDRAKALGIPISDIFSSLQTYLGGTYINDFNLFGRTFKVTAQAEGAARTMPESSTACTCVRNRVTCAAIDLVSIRPVQGLRTSSATTSIARLPSTARRPPDTARARPSPQWRSSAAVLPEGFTYYWTGSVYQQKQTGGQAPYIFAMALGFVFLLLAALYESWGVPFAVILCIPFAVFRGVRRACNPPAWRTISTRRLDL